jgi:Protein of unknown function (DUF2934)
MKAVHEDLIRARAYEIWESQGRPTGFDRQHWEQAERELLDAAPDIEERTPAQPATAQDAATNAAQHRPEQGTLARPGDRAQVREAPRVR